MIAPAPHHRLQLAHRFGVGGHAAGLFDHQHAEPIAECEQFGRGRIVRAAVGVAAHRLELAQAPFVQAVRDGGADAGVILVVVGAMQLEWCAVQQEAALCVEDGRAHAERRDQRIDRLAFAVHAGGQVVELRGVDRPQRSLAERQGLLDALYLAGCNGDRGAGCLCDDAAIRRGHVRLHRALARGAAIVAHFGGQLRGGVVAVHGAAHEHAVLRQMQRVGLVQPQMAVDAGAFVEPAFAQRGIHAHGDEVGLAVVEHFAEIDLEAAIAAGVAPDDVAVAEHDAVAEHTVEHQADAPAQIACGNLQRAPIPAHAGFRKAGAQRLVAVRSGQVLFGDGGRDRFLPEGQGDRPVVRQIQQFPATVVEGELRGGGSVLARLGEAALEGAELEIARWVAGVTKMEAPTEVEQQPFARCQGCIAECGKRRGVVGCSWRCSGDGGQQRTGRTDRKCGAHATGEHAAQQLAAIDAGHGWVLLRASVGLPGVIGAGLAAAG